MSQRFFSFCTLMSLAVVPAVAHATEFQFGVYGGGVTSSITVSYGTATDSKSGGLELSGISGTFSDANIGIDGATITGLQPLNIQAPEPSNLLAPADFSHFNVASGLPHGFASYDNLLYLSGSPQTASSYPPHGGLLDIYGLMFTLDDGDTVNVWSNGDVGSGGAIDYGAYVLTSATVLDAVPSGITATPEPGTLCLLGTGALSLAGVARKRLMRRSA